MSDILRTLDRFLHNTLSRVVKTPVTVSDVSLPLR